MLRNQRRHTAPRWRGVTSSVTLVWIFVVSIFARGCRAWLNYHDIKPEWGGKVCPAASRVFEIPAPSGLSCALACRAFSDPDCIGSSYDVTSGMCIGCNCDPVQDPAIFEPLPGAIFTLQETTSMMHGRCGKVTAISAYYNDTDVWEPVSRRKVQIWEDRYWRPQAENYYLKLDFEKLRLVEEVVIMGRVSDDGVEEWVSDYMLLTSLDCVTIDYIEEFWGNWDVTTNMKYPLTTPQRARCAWFHPQSWNNWPSWRVDLRGF